MADVVDVAAIALNSNGYNRTTGARDTGRLDTSIAYRDYIHLSSSFPVKDLMRARSVTEPSQRLHLQTEKEEKKNRPK